MIVREFLVHCLAMGQRVDESPGVREGSELEPEMCKRRSAIVSPGSPKRYVGAKYELYRIVAGAGVEVGWKCTCCVNCLAAGHLPLKDPEGAFSL